MNNQVTMKHWQRYVLIVITYSVSHEFCRTSCRIYAYVLIWKRKWDFASLHNIQLSGPDRTTGPKRSLRSYTSNNDNDHDDRFPWQERIRWFCTSQLLFSTIPGWSSPDKKYYDLLWISKTSWKNIGWGLASGVKYKKWGEVVSIRVYVSVEAALASNIW